MNLMNVGIYSAVTIPAVVTGLYLATLATPGGNTDAKAAASAPALSLDSPAGPPALSSPLTLRAPDSFAAPNAQLQIEALPQAKSQQEADTELLAPTLSMPLTMAAPRLEPGSASAPLDQAYPGLSLVQPMRLDSNQPAARLQLASFSPAEAGGTSDLHMRPKASLTMQAAGSSQETAKPLAKTPAPQLAALDKDTFTAKDVKRLKANILEEAEDIAARFLDSDVEMLKLESSFEEIKPSLMPLSPMTMPLDIQDNLDLSSAKYSMNTPLPASEKATGIIVFKSQRLLHLMQDDILLKSYAIDLGFNPVGHKLSEGDGKTPEGDYIIDWRNEQSQFHRSLHISYPNVQDTEIAALAGRNPGGAIMIHGRPNAISDATPLGSDWTAGCIAVSNAQMDELMNAVSDTTPISIRA